MNAEVFIALFSFIRTVLMDQGNRQFPPIVKAQANVSRMPQWIRQHLGDGAQFGSTHRAIQQHQLHTVCEEARCPNRGECWSRGTATFMLLGDTCTRACGFCSVKTGRPGALNEHEPAQVVDAVRDLGLKYIVLTSVNRDDLADGGAGIFAESYRLLKALDPFMGVEFLTPDFQQDQKLALDIIMKAVRHAAHAGDKPRLVWGHNIETVPALYKKARKGSKYQRSLDLLSLISAQDEVEAKSAIMLGLGETHEQVIEVLHDLRAAGVARVAMGQYLRPTMQHLPVESYIHPTEFQALEEIANDMGFSWVKAGPMVRSSYHAED